MKINGLYDVKSRIKFLRRKYPLANLTYCEDYFIQDFEDFYNVYRIVKNENNTYQIEHVKFNKEQVEKNLPQVECKDGHIFDTIIDLDYQQGFVSGWTANVNYFNEVLAMITGDGEFEIVKKRSRKKTH